MNPPSITKWEYKFSNKQTEKHMLLELSELGAEGWEAFSLSYNKDVKGIWCWTAWLRRPAGAAAHAPTAHVAHAVEATPVAEAASAGGTSPAGFDLSDGDFDFKEGE